MYVYIYICVKEKDLYVQCTFRLCDDSYVYRVEIFVDLYMYENHKETDIGHK